jgi:hypothetical protein
MTDNETVKRMRQSLREGFSTPVYVNFTTWKKREMFVPTMLSHFSHQTFKPTKIICWLSISEYHHTIPQHVQECLDNHLLDEVRWVRGNTYCHKRWEAFKYYGDGYNLMIDDDLYYPEDYVETLLAYSLAYPRTVVCYYGRRSIYKQGSGHMRHIFPSLPIRMSFIADCAVSLQDFCHPMSSATGGNGPCIAISVTTLGSRRGLLSTTFW